MLVVGYLCVVLMGVVLGLMGGGGAILTVPILAYLFKVEPSHAINYSLFIIGFSSLFGVYNHWKLGNIRWEVVPKFGGASIAGVLITKKIIFPLIPHELFSIGNTIVTKDKGTLILFAALMILASYSMMMRKVCLDCPPENNQWRFVAQGFLVGVVTGLLGAGGGFLIIPALILFAKLPMKNAVATSLTIISINALIGFFSTVMDISIQWGLLLAISIFALVGLAIGTFIFKRVNSQKVQSLFAILLLCVGLIVLTKELFIH